MTDFDELRAWLQAVRQMVDGQARDAFDVTVRGRALHVTLHPEAIESAGVSAGASAAHHKGLGGEAPPRPRERRVKAAPTPPSPPAASPAHQLSLFDDED